MSQEPNENKLYARHYHREFNANVVAISNDPKQPKKPNHKYTNAPYDYKARPQTADEVAKLPWNRANGVGIISGVNGWRCFDFDSIKTDEGLTQYPDGVPFEVVKTFCDGLGLDASTYQWVARSNTAEPGQRTPTGWHVWVLCFDEWKDGTDDQGVEFYRTALPEFAGMFDHIERRWHNNYTITPPSVLSTGKRYTWENWNEFPPIEPPATVTREQIENALRRVVMIEPTPTPDPAPTKPTDAKATPIRATLHESNEAKYYDPNTGTAWDSLSDYERDEQTAKDEARRRFDLVAYIQRHIGTTDTVDEPNGERRVGKHGAGFGGWYVKPDGQTWNTFCDGKDGTTGGDCFALVSFCEYDTTTVTDADKWRNVLSIVERETGVRFPQRRHVKSAPVGGGNNDQGQTEPVRRSNRDTKPTKAELVLEQLAQFRFRRNELSHQIEWQPVDGDAETWHNLNDDHVAKWRVAFELNTGKTVSKNDYSDYIVTVTTPYDPLHEYFDSLPKWDGTTDHVGALAMAVDTPDPELFADHLRKWLIGTFATGYHGAETQRTVNELFLVLSGEQGTGKTTFLTALVPKMLRRYLYVGTIEDNKDSKQIQTESFVILNDELAGLRAKEIEHVKSMLSNTQYKYRRPYDKYATNHKRRVSFCGTTNEDEFLTDHTGNRRFVIHIVHGVEFTVLTDELINGVWGQVRALHDQGVRHWLTKDDVLKLNKQNARFAQQTYTDGLVERYLRPAKSDTPTAEHLGVHEVAQRLAELYDQEHTQSGGKYGDVDVRDGTKRPDPERIIRPLGKTLQKLGFKRESARRGINGARYGFWLTVVPKHERDLAENAPGKGVVSSVVSDVVSVVSNAPVEHGKQVQPTWNDPDEVPF